MVFGAEYARGSLTGYSWSSAEHEDAAMLHAALEGHMSGAPGSDKCKLNVRFGANPDYNGSGLFSLMSFENNLIDRVRNSTYNDSIDLTIKVQNRNECFELYKCMNNRDL